MAGLDTRVSRLLGTRYPIVQAPMAGGFTTPELVAAVSNAGALGSLGGATLGPVTGWRSTTASNSVAASSNWRLRK